MNKSFKIRFWRWYERFGNALGLTLGILVILAIIISISEIYIVSNFFSYKEFHSYTSIRNSGIFSDSIKDQLFILKAQKDSNDDTLIFLKTNNELLITICIIDNYKGTPVDSISVSRWEKFSQSQGKTIFIDHVEEGHNVTTVKSKVFIPESSKLNLGFSNCTNFPIGKEYTYSLIFETSCSSIAFLDNANNFDFEIIRSNIVQSTNKEGFGSKLISSNKSQAILTVFSNPNRFFILLMSSLENKDVGLTELFSIVNKEYIVGK